MEERSALHDYGAKTLIDGASAPAEPGDERRSRARAPRRLPASERRAVHFEAADPEARHRRSDARLRRARRRRLQRQRLRRARRPQGRGPRDPARPRGARRGEARSRLRQAARAGEVRRRRRAGARRVDRRRVLPRADRRDGPAGLHRAVGVQLLPARLRRSRHHRAGARIRDPEHVVRAAPARISRTRSRSPPRSRPTRRSLVRPARRSTGRHGPRCPATPRRSSPGSTGC